MTFPASVKKHQNPCIITNTIIFFIKIHGDNKISYLFKFENLQNFKNELRNTTSLS